MAFTDDDELIKRISSDVLIDQLQALVMAPGRFRLDSVLSSTAKHEAVAKGDFLEVMELEGMLRGAHVALAELQKRTGIVSRHTKIQLDEDNRPSA